MQTKRKGDDLDSCFLFSVQVLFTQIDQHAKYYIELFLIKEDEFPTCRILDLTDPDGVMKKFKPEFSGIGTDDVKTFVEDYLKG